MNMQISHNTTNCIGSRMPMNAIVGGGECLSAKNISAFGFYRGRSIVNGICLIRETDAIVVSYTQINHK